LIDKLRKGTDRLAQKANKSHKHEKTLLQRLMTGRRR
jgi:hypothetical protein